MSEEHKQVIEDQLDKLAAELMSTGNELIGEAGLVRDRSCELGYLVGVQVMLTELSLTVGKTIQAVCPDPD